jgi:hypothetical protein
MVMSKKNYKKKTRSIRLHPKKGGEYNCHKLTWDACNAYDRYDCMWIYDVPGGRCVKKVDYKDYL